MYIDWVKTNVKEILNDRTKSFDVTLNMYPFKKMSFAEATEYTINQMRDRYGKLYVSFSGGYDSYYIVEQMRLRGIDFVPVIVNVPWNTLELEFAFHWCHTNKIDPIILEIEKLEFFKTYAMIHKKWGNCRGVGNVPSIFAAYELKKKNINHLILGTNLINDGFDNPRNINFDMHDFYYELFDDIIMEPFFIDNLSIVESYVNFIRPDHFRTDYFKSELYSLPYRPKLGWGRESSYAEINDISTKVPELRNFNEAIYLDYEKFKLLLANYCQ
jgi:hypothetical protein